MKKLLSLSLLCLGLLGGARAQTCSTTITTYPYLENFDGATAPGWIGGGFNSSWAMGTPAKLTLTTAASGTKCWTTNLSGNYNASEHSFVESPCFNMSTLVQPIVEMKVWWNSEFSWDGAVLMSSIDNGATWQKVGAYGDPNNWYNDNNINSGPGGQPGTTAEGWTGHTSTGNGSNGWITAKHVLTGLGGQANVKLRIEFGSDNAYHFEGFAFDSFSIYETPANEAGISSITSPTSPIAPLVAQPVMVTVKNFGSAALNSATIGWSVNKVVQPDFAFTASPSLATNSVSAPVQIGTFSFPAGLHKVKAWSKNPNGATDPNPANDTTTITINSCVSMSGNFTIDKNSATSATNFPSFAAVAQAMGSCGISGPVIFNVAPGSGPYNEAVNFTKVAGTSATNTITFNGNGNTVSASPATISEAVIKLNGAQFVRFNNFTIENLTANASGSTVLLINNASNNIITGCTMNNSTTSTATFYGVHLASGSNNNKFQNNVFNGGYYGVYNNGVNTAPLLGNEFIGNTLKDQYNYGIYSSYTTNTLIEGNDISRPTRINGSSFYGVYFSAGVLSAVVNKNRIHNTHDAAIPANGSFYGVYTISPATPGNENIIKNNLIYNINNTNGMFYGFYNGGGNGTHYYHNTVTADPGMTYNILRGFQVGTSTSNVKVINNIFSLPSTATAKHAIYIGSGSTVVSNNNDLYIGTTGMTGNYASADKATLADWKTANTNAYDQNSVAVEPYFATATYLQPGNIALNNAGQPTPVTDDIIGITRSTTTPDMGSYEFTPSANDAGITAILSPTSPVTPGSQAVTVTLRNFGTATLATATIGWSINKVAQPNFAWTGSLATAQASTPINIGNFNFPAGNLTLKVWSKLPNGAADGLAVNDTTTLQLISCAPLAGNYSINKNNPTAGTNFQSFADAIQQLRSCGISDPVTLTVTANTGPYTEQLDIRNIPNASATNTVTFEGSGNTIMATPGLKPGIVVFDGAKYVKVNNFVLSLDPAVTTGWGVQLMNAADYNTISNNTINLPLNTTNSNFNGIVSGPAISTNGNHASYTKIQNNTINGGYYGIQLNGNSGGVNSVNNEITGNQLKDAYIYGIYLNHTNGTLIEGNDISRPTRTNGLGFNFIYITGTTMKTMVSKNKMHNVNDMATSKAGIIYGVYLGSAATPGNENIFKNNTLYNIESNLGNFYPFYNSGGNGAYFYHNSVATDPASNYNIIRGFQMNSAATNVKFINNNLYLPGTATGKHAIYLSMLNTQLVSDNNNLYVGTSGNIGYYNNANKPTLADWQLSAMYDQNSVTSDPVFVNAPAGNLKPNSATFDNLGQAVPTVTEDILGGTRHTTTPDIGAFEFGVPANDVGITSVSTPKALDCGLTTAETITVTIRNYGANPQPAVPVLLFVDGIQVTATPETYNTSPIAPNTSATYTFTATANLAANGSHRIIAKTQLAGDVTTINDADTLDIMNPLVAALPVTFGFETPADLAFFRKDIRNKSNIVEHVTASSPFVTTSTKGLIMDGATDISWLVPAGITDPWTNNANHFSAIYMCVNPAGGTATDSLWLTFDIKQLFKTANVNTNFRVTINGTMVGTTYRPPFDPANPATPNNWRHIKVDLNAFKNAASIMIGLESNVMQEYANGNGTANLIDNLTIVRRLVTNVGVKEYGLAANVSVYPNPGNGLFKVSLPAGKAFNLEVTDLTGKVLQHQKTVGETELKLQSQAKGIYLLKVSGENGSAVRKLIVE